MAQTIKNLPAAQEIQVRILGQEDPLEKEMATHSSILAWRIPWTEESGGLQSMGSQRLLHNLATEQQQSYKSSGLPPLNLTLSLTLRTLPLTSHFWHRHPRIFAIIFVLTF